jgi:hypothetical protein
MQTCGCCGKHALIGPDSFGSECRAQREWTSPNRAFCDLLHQGPGRRQRPIPGYEGPSRPDASETRAMSPREVRQQQHDTGHDEDRGRQLRGRPATPATPNTPARFRLTGS